MKTSAQILNLILLTCILILAGCGSSNKQTQKEIPSTAFEKKKAALVKQIDRKFENPQAHFELAKLYESERMWSQAEYEYNAALSFSPTNKAAQAGMVKVIEQSGDKAKARNYADLYIDQSFSSAYGSFQLGRSFQDEGLDEYALRCYQQALHLTPDSYRVNRQLGYYYLSKADLEQAKTYLSRSFDLNPNQSDVAGELGKLGVPVKIPPKTKNSGKKLDKLSEQNDKSLK
jgi:tetratricopeptide (TPR) repeat protein